MSYCSVIFHILQSTLADLKNYFYPWNFLFTGSALSASAKSKSSRIFEVVDTFCSKYKWEAQERVLLSLAALQIKDLSRSEMSAVCRALSSRETEVMAALNLLCKLQSEGLLHKFTHLHSAIKLIK